MRLAERTSFRLGEGHRKQARIDGEWLHDSLMEWLKNPMFRRNLSVTANSLCSVWDSRIHMPWVVPGAGVQASLNHSLQRTSIRYTPYIEWVLHATRNPVPYTLLLEDSSTEFPQLDAGRIDLTLAQLISHGFLLTSVTPETLDESYVARLAEILSVAGQTTDFLEALEGYQETKIGEGRPSWGKALSEMRSLSPHIAPAIQVDMRLEGAFQLPHSVGKEAANYATVMTSLAPEVSPLSHLSAYRDLFHDKYGRFAAVPLPDLIDPHRGLGYPVGYVNPTTESTESGFSASHGRQNNKTRQLIAELVQDALLAEDREVRLTDEVLRCFPRKESSRVPESMELCLQILAESQQEIDSGNFRLATPSFMGTWRSGASSGRFARLLENEEEISRGMSLGAQPDTINAQLTFAPSSPRALNVMQAPPNLLHYRLPVGTFCDTRDPQTIDWRDLLVSSASRGLELTWSKTGQRVVPVVPHVLDMSTGAPNLARFLNEIGFSMTRPWTTWDWSGFEYLPILPRVVYGRIVVSPMRWVPDRHVRDTTLEWSSWQRALSAWRSRYSVPDNVQLSRGDHSLPVHLDDTWHQEILRDELKRGDIHITEDLTENGRFLGWCGGHTNEVVFPMHSDSSSAKPKSQMAQLPPITVNDKHRKIHLPGGEWLFSSFYLRGHRQDSFIAHRLPELLREISPHIQSWFYIRYRDPAAHLRVRFRGSPEQLHRNALPILERQASRWRESGVISAMTLGQYEPEEIRYGGSESTRLAEKVFAVDSVSAVAQMRALQSGRFQLQSELIAALNYAVLLDAIGPWDWVSWVESSVLRGEDHRTYQKLRKQADQIILPGQAADALARVSGIPEMARLWSEANECRDYGASIGISSRESTLPAVNEEAIHSVLHMQHNRISGIDPAHEMRSFAVLRGVAATLSSKMRHNSMGAMKGVPVRE